MGVDRKDVGLVLHLDLPSTPESFLQQAGRAGRDGSPANCIVWFSPSDRTKISWALCSSSVKKIESADEVLEEQRMEIFF